MLYEDREGTDIYYYYDSYGTPTAIAYVKADGTSYTFYVGTNSLGDVNALYNASGGLAVKYDYDAWGRIVAETNATGGAITGLAAEWNEINPFRYRGYYYDKEIGLYYLQSRYYDAQTGRFINSDEISTIVATPTDLTDKNLFIYCDNNPIIRSDDGGEFWVTAGIMAVGGLIGAAISAVSSAVTQKVITGEVNWKSVGVAAATGFVSGAIAASPLKIVGQQVAGGIIGGLSYAADCYVNNRSMKIDEAILSVASGTISGRIGGAGANKNMVLTNTIERSKSIVARESFRANQEYAQKMITSTMKYTCDTIDIAIWGASSRFAAGCGVSNGFMAWYSEQQPFPNIPSWNP